MTTENQGTFSTTTTEGSTINLNATGSSSLNTSYIPSWSYPQETEADKIHLLTTVLGNPSIPSRLRTLCGEILETIIRNKFAAIVLPSEQSRDLLSEAQRVMANG